MEGAKSAIIQDIACMSDLINVSECFGKFF
jgi:hypothetical protein